MAVTTVLQKVSIVDERVVSSETGSVLYKHTCPFTNVSAHYSTDDTMQVVVADTNKTVHLMSIENKTVSILHSLRVPKSPTSVCFGALGSLYISDRFGDIFSLSLTDSTALVPMAGSVSTITKLALLHLQLLAADRDEKVRIFNTNNGELEGFLLAHTLYVSAVVVVGDKVVVGGGDRFVTVWSGEFPVSKTCSEPYKKVFIEQEGVYEMCAINDKLVLVLFDSSSEGVIIDIIEGLTVSTFKFASIPTSITCVNGTIIVGFVDNSIQHYTMDGTDLQHCKTIKIEPTENAVSVDLLWKNKYRKTFYEEDGEEHDEEEHGKRRKH